LLALMVVWGYPCESKSSPAHYSKHPHSKEWGCFFCLSDDYFKNNINSIKYGKIQNDEGN
ncbi:hypothetical protein, partial [Acinetobacter nosocomialis]|uniref:hypothetical protein n=1 Tax=Acinetobacter nosocomialis TaxID=106654 RepID=UPI0025A2F5DE